MEAETHRVRHGVLPGVEIETARIVFRKKKYSIRRKAFTVKEAGAARF